CGLAVLRRHHELELAGAGRKLGPRRTRAVPAGARGARSAGAQPYPLRRRHPSFALLRRRELRKLGLIMAQVVDRRLLVIPALVLIAAAIFGYLAGRGHVRAAPKEPTLTRPVGAVLLEVPAGWRLAASPHA